MSSYENGSDSPIDPESVSAEEARRRALERASDEDLDARDRLLDALEAPEEAPDEEFEATGNKYITPFLVDRLAARAGRILSEEGLSGESELNAETYTELCSILGQSIISDQSVAALEDLLLTISENDFRYRTLGDPITIDDLEEEGAKFDDPEDFSRFQDQLTSVSYSAVRQLVEDPILELPLLQERKQGLIDEQRDLKLKRNEARQAQKGSSDWSEYSIFGNTIEAQTKRIQEIEGLIKALDREAEGLVSITEVRERRERAIRRFNWLADQEYMQPGVEQLRELVAKDEAMNFAQAVQLMMSGIDALLQTHEQEGLDISTATAKARRRYDIQGQRYRQAQAICRNVFEPDLQDGIYEEEPIQPKDLGAIQFLRKMLYERGQSRPLDEIVALLPGSGFRESGDYMSNEPLIKFGGKTKKQLIDDVDTIIENDLDLDEQTIRDLMEAKNRRTITTGTEELELAEYALLVAEHLAYGYKYPLNMLLSR